MISLPWIFGLAAAGFLGGMLLARRPGSAAWLIWLCLPFVGLFALLLIEAGFDAPDAHKGDKVVFGLVLYSLVIALPWLGANLLGRLLGKRLWPARVAGACSGRIRSSRPGRDR